MVEDGEYCLKTGVSTTSILQILRQAEAGQSPEVRVPSGESPYGFWLEAPLRDTAKAGGTASSTYLGLDVDGQRGNVALQAQRWRERPRQVKEGFSVHSHDDGYSRRLRNPVVGGLAVVSSSSSSSSAFVAGGGCRDCPPGRCSLFPRDPVFSRLQHVVNS
jgi:hypothetical protein